MTDAALADRIDGIRQLGGVVRAMTGIAGARARTARAQIAAVDAYSVSLDAALRQARALAGAGGPPPESRPALVVFCAEQGFVGGFSDRVLDAVPREGADLFLIGSRGVALAQGRGMVPVWSAAMPSRSASLPGFADRLLSALLAQGVPRAVDVLRTTWERGQGRVERLALFPLPSAASLQAPPAPLTNLPAADLVVAITLDTLHAGLTRAALQAFVAENEARRDAMAAAARQIDDELARLQALSRRQRQEAITEEILEISSGAQAGLRSPA